MDPLSLLCYWGKKLKLSLGLQDFFNMEFSSFKTYDLEMNISLAYNVLFSFFSPPTVSCKGAVLEEGFPPTLQIIKLWREPI